MPIALVTVIPPTKFEMSNIENRIGKMKIKNRASHRRPIENILCKSMVWMPYHRLQFNFRRFRNDLVPRSNETGRGETALNAMLCGAVKNDSEFSMLFRPNYLKYETVKHVPLSEEILIPSVYVDFNEVLNRLLKRLIEVKYELNDLRSALSRRYARMRRYSMIVPMVGSDEKEKMISEKVAKLNAEKIVLSMGMNVENDIESIEVTDHSVFYYPNLFTLEYKENEVERYFVFDLIGRERNSKIIYCDEGLTKLCNENVKCKEVMTRAIASACKIEKFISSDDRQRSALF